MPHYINLLFTYLLTDSQTDTAKKQWAEYHLRSSPANHRIVLWGAHCQPNVTDKMTKIAHLQVAASPLRLLFHLSHRQVTCRPMVKLGISETDIETTPRSEERSGCPVFFQPWLSSPILLAQLLDFRQHTCSMIILAFKKVQLYK